jgi:hypothetical protein
MRIEAWRGYLGVYLCFYDDFDNGVEVGSTGLFLPDIVVKLSQRFVVDSRAGT